MEFRLDLNVIKAEEHQSQFALVLHNLSEKVIENWTLHFTVTRYITPESVTYGDLSQTGTLCRYTTGEALQPNSHVYVEFSHKTKPFTFFDEGITEACLHISQGENIEIFAVETTPVDLAMATPARTSLILPAPHQINLIPQPKAMVQTTGFFAFDDHCAIVACEESKAAATWLMEEINTHLNQNYIIKREGNILFRLDENLPLSGYRLSVQVEKIILTAASSQGFVHGVSSILQLVPPNPSHRHTSAYQVPCVEIEDTPRFKYRGMMLDCARHFHPISRIKSLINQLARYKFNFFQWHLTDDEGWRIEIDAYPELTEIGAWRGPFETLEPQYTNLTNIHGGFYKKSEIRDVIEYAEQRGITVIPEIDIPGHCRAAIKSLPDLLIENNDLSEYRSIQHFSDNVLNPGIKGTYQFLENVLNEVCELFPSSYIHIGADVLLLKPLKEQLGEQGAFKLALAECYIETQQFEQAEALLTAVLMQDQDAKFKELIAKIELFKQAMDTPEIRELQQAYEQNPSDFNIGYELAIQFNQVNKQEDALTILIKILQSDVNYADGDVKKTTMDILASLGQGNEIASRFRRQLYALLY